jgi:hypothetical protein
VTGLDGDKWDYIIEREAEDASTNASTWIRFNNDATANYRWYVMGGTSISGVTGVTNEAQTQVYCEDFKNGRSSITRNLISGSSGSERYVSTFSAGETNTSGTGVYILSHYWKNTVDNITSIQILENSSVTTTSTIRIYQVPKQANLDNYDLVDVVEFTNRSTDIVFSGLDGDSDKEYLIDWQTDTIDNPLIWLNGDTSSNYAHQWLRNNNGTIQAVYSVNTGVNPNGNNLHNFIKINAETGRKRLCTISTASNVAYQQSETVVWWGNTVDNLTSITIGLLTNITGTVKLYKRKSNKTIDPVPMETVVEYDINGVDFSNGITITGIEGDRINGAIKVEHISSKVVGSNAWLHLQINGDTSGNYSSQKLDSSLSSVVAGTASNNFIYLGAYITSSDITNGYFYLYPQSGQNRPCLNYYNWDSSAFSFRSECWNNSVDEITSMKIYASNTNLVTGKIRISVPKGTKQATNSWQVTVN